MGDQYPNRKSRIVLQKHHIIDRQIRDLTVRRDLAGIGQNERLFHVIIVVLYKSAQRAVDGVVLAGFDLDGDGGEAVVIVDQIIHLALAAVIVIEQLVACLLYTSALGTSYQGLHEALKRINIFLSDALIYINRNIVLEV